MPFVKPQGGRQTRGMRDVLQGTRPQRSAEGEGVGGEQRSGGRDEHEANGGHRRDHDVGRRDEVALSGAGLYGETRLLLGTRRGWFL